MLEKNTIHKIDVINGLKKLDTGSIDLIITSPPYNLGSDHHTGTKKTNTYFDNMDENQYQEWQLEVLNECCRVLKDEGSMFYNHKNRIKNGTQITPYSWILKSSFNVKQELVWINRSQNFDKIRFYPWTERVYWLTKNPKTKLKNTLNKNDVFDWNEWKPVGTKGEHKRAFPVKMVTDLIEVSTPNDIILDPFMGSGTVAIGALTLQKSYIGFEISDEYVELSNKRIEDFKSQLSLDF